MKFSTILGAAAAMATVVPATAIDMEESRKLFKTWQKEFNVEYSSPVEREARFKNFMANLMTIEVYNMHSAAAGKDMPEDHVVQYSVNRFSDMTPVEFASTLTYKTSKPSARLNPHLTNLGKDYPEAYPATEEDKNCVFPVRDQGQCGSCWAFATAAVAEAAACKATGEKFDLSPQELVDCDTNQAGCGGAYFINEPIDYIAKAKGLCTYAEYPYTAQDGQCKASECSHHGDVIAKSFDLSSADELAASIAKYGAVSVAVDASSFQFYSGGVLTPDNCSNWGLNHAVTATGYKVVDGKLIVKIKNSWAANWGEDGFVHVQYGACGLGQEMAGAVVPAIDNKKAKATTFMA